MRSLAAKGVGHDDRRAEGYPHPSSPQATAVMKGNRKRDTRPEMALRSALHRVGFRFRRDYPIRLEGRRTVRVDIAFTKARVAVFVDGCFWHSCPEHGNRPKVNDGYWGPKLARNVQRDREHDEALRSIGWRSIRVWEHEDVDQATERVAREVRGAPDQCRGGA